MRSKLYDCFVERKNGQTNVEESNRDGNSYIVLKQWRKKEKGMKR